MSAFQLPLLSTLRACVALVCSFLCYTAAVGQLVDDGRESSPPLAQPRSARISSAPLLFPWDKKDLKSPEFPTWLDNEVDWACTLYQSTEDYLAAAERLQDLPDNVRTAKLRAFLAECLLEKSPPEVDMADRIMRTISLQADGSPYIRYVQARVAFARKEPLQAATFLGQAVQKGLTFSPWQRQRALTILKTAAERKTIVIDRRQLTARLDAPAPAWLQAGQTLTQEERPKLPVVLLLRMHLAENGNDPTLLDELLLPATRAELLQQQDGSTLLTILLIRQAQRLEKTEPHRALTNYLDLLRLLADHPEATALSKEEIQKRFTPQVLSCVERLSGQKNPERVRRWVTQAVAEVDSAAWWNLQGFAAYNRAVREATTERVAQQAHLALEAFDRAVSKGRVSQPSDPLLDIYYANRSGSFLLLGMYSTEDRRQYLTRAVEDAREATRRNPQSESAWSALGHATELLAWRELGIGARESYPIALQAFQTQIEKGTNRIEGQANLGRCLVKRGLEEDADSRQLAQGQNTLQQVLDQMPNHWDANFWLGRIYLERGDLDAAALVFAKAVRHPQHGLHNALRIGRLLANRPEELRQLLQKVLPEAPDQWHEEHALWLIMRSNYFRREYTRDLDQPQPQAVRDAEAAYRLTANPLVKLRALEALAAAQRASALHRRAAADLRQQHRQAAMKTMRELLRLDPAAPRMWEWGQELAQLLEEDANNASLPGEDQRRLFNEAVGCVQLALAYAPPEQRKDLEQFREELIRQGAKADPKRKLAEPK
jgi:tetratricopeptide (TPR) repeat protein